MQNNKEYLFADGSKLTCDDSGDANDDERLDLSDAVSILLGWTFAHLLW